MLDLHIELLTLEAMPYLVALSRAPTIDDLDDALGVGYRRLEGQLPLEEASDLYCDLDARWEAYRDALLARFAAHRSGVQS
jgi:hypothetical protein